MVKNGGVDLMNSSPVACILLEIVDGGFDCVVKAPLGLPVPPCGFERLFLDLSGEACLNVFGFYTLESKEKLDS